MAKFSVIKSGGKQFLVAAGETIVTEKVTPIDEKKVQLDVLMRFDGETGDIELGAPLLDKKAEAEVVAQLKGEKIRVAKFKSKVRYRRVRGFRPQLSKLKFNSI